MQGAQRGRACSLSCALRALLGPTEPGRRVCRQRSWMWKPVFYQKRTHNLDVGLATDTGSRARGLGQPSTAEVQCESSPCPQCTPPSWPRSLLHWAQAAPTYSKPISCWFPASWAYGLGLFTVLLRAGQVCCRPAQTA